MTRLIPALLVAIALLPAETRAQQLRNFSGVWELDVARSDDHVYGQLRVISAAPSQINMTVFHVASGQTSIIPWELPLDRWRPRRGGDDSREPVVQSRWDGNSRALANGREAIVSLRGNTLITARD